MMVPRRAPKASALASALLSLATVLAGCKPDPHPWDQGDAAPPPPPPRPAIASAEPRILDQLPHAAPEASTGGVEAPSEAEDGGPPVRVGGPWVRCYGSFRISGDVVKDVTRLSLLCGPENGMSRLGDKALEGAVTEGGAAVTTTFEAKRGACYRLFAVAEPSVGDLDVVVRSSRGAPLAADHGEDAWPIVQPDRPFCALEDDRYTVEVSAKRGAGRFALETWVLQTPPAKTKGPARGRATASPD
jgi:hypothetical protein